MTPVIGDDCYQLAVTLVVALAIGALATLVRRPLIIAFMEVSSAL